MGSAAGISSFSSIAANWINFPFQGYEGSLIKLTSKQVRRWILQLTRPVILKTCTFALVLQSCLFIQLL